MLISGSNDGEKYSKKILDKISMKSLTTPANENIKNFNDPPLNFASNVRLDRDQNDDNLQPHKQYL